MNTAIVIPARYASVRLPGKPLLQATGKFLIQHVYEQALEVRSAGTVVVATDDDRIAAAVSSFGGRVMMTRAEHPSGTDRVAEVAERLPNVDVVVNLQGDEPQFDPAAVELLIDQMRDGTAAMATLATPIRDAAVYHNPNAVKVVTDDHRRALYFSRSPIPFVRDGEPDFASEPPRFLLHLGVYAYRRAELLRIAQTPPHPLEQQEKLEQLRMLGSGGIIRLGVVPRAHRGVDTQADYDAFVASYRSDRGRRAA